MENANERPPKRTTYDLEERTARFAENVIELCKRIKRTSVSDPIIRHLIRSSTSVGANYCEADDAVSNKEFRQKIGYCKKEARESKYWLRMLAKAESLAVEHSRILWQEAHELHLIFATIFRKVSTKKPPNSND